MIIYDELKNKEITYSEVDFDKGYVKNINDKYFYILYTKEELETNNNIKKLNKLKEELNSTDYEAIKYSEGWYTDEEYQPIKEKREEIRNQIRAIIDKE